MIARHFLPTAHVTHRRPRRRRYRKPVRRPMRSWPRLPGPRILSASASARRAHRIDFPGPDLEDALDGPPNRRALGLMPDPLPAEAPVARVTLSRAAILSARTILLVISGAQKRAVVERALRQVAFPARPSGGFWPMPKLRIEIHWSPDMSLHPTIEAVTEAISERSGPTRRAYLDLIARERETGVDRPNLACGKSCARLCRRR